MMNKQMAALIALLLTLTMLAGCAAGTGGRNGSNSTDVTQEELQTYPGLGGVMPALRVTTVDGQELTLSQLLEEKELVVLNFWFQDCPWCLIEFPVMEAAYQRYQEDVEIIALNPVDTADAVRAFQKDKGLSFPMASCPRAWAVEMGVGGYPTSVFIDRDGVICLVHAGAITDAETFDAVFETFTADDYERKIYNSISQLVS